MVEIPLPIFDLSQFININQQEEHSIPNNNNIIHDITVEARPEFINISLNEVPNNISTHCNENHLQQGKAFDKNLNKVFIFIIFF